jgi:hypothetical protein
VTRSSGAVVAEEITSVLVIDCKSLVGANVNILSRVPSVSVIEGVGISDGSSKLTVIEGNSVVSSTMLVDRGSTETAGVVEMSITVGVSGEALSNELMEAIGSNVEERTTALVMDGESPFRTDTGEASTVKSVLVVMGGDSERSLKLEVTDDSSPSAVLVGRGSRLIVELPVQDIMMDEASCVMGLASRTLVSRTAGMCVVELKTSTLILDGMSVVEGNTEFVSRVTPISVVDNTEFSDCVSPLALIVGISEDCSRGSVVTEDSLSSTELLTGS